MHLGALIVIFMILITGNTITQKRVIILIIQHNKVRERQFSERSTGATYPQQ